MAINLGSELVKQAFNYEKRINIANGTKIYTITKNIGTFHDVFKGTQENGSEAITLACEVPLRAPIHTVKLQIIHRSGQAMDDLFAGLPIPQVDVGTNVNVVTDVSVLPINLLRDCPMIDDNSAAISKMINRYKCTATDNNGFNLYGVKLSESFFYPITRFVFPIENNTADQTFQLTFSHDVSMLSSYGSLVSCRQGSYNVFREPNTDDPERNLEADGTSRRRFSLASIFKDNEAPKESEKKYNNFNAGSGTIVVSTTLVNALNGAITANAIYARLFLNDYNNCDVVLQVVYGEPFDDDITAFSTEHFIR